MENIHVLCSYILIGVLTFNNLKKIKWKWKSSNINSHFSSFFHSFIHLLVHSFIHSSFISTILGKFLIGKYMYSTHNNNNNITASIPTAISCSNSYFYDGKKAISFFCSPRVLVHTTITPCIRKLPPGLISCSIRFGWGCSVKQI